MIPQAELDRLLQSPAMKSPPGLTPNLKNPPKHFFADRLVTMVLCLAFATLFVAMRMYTKLFVMKRHGWEDYTCFLAWVLFIPYELMHLLLYKFGAGAHLWDISVGRFSNWAKIVYARELYNVPLIYITKLFILFQFQRMFVTRRSGTAYWCIQTVIWINTLYYIACGLAIAFHCTPIHKAWQPWYPGHCINVHMVIIAASMINVGSDIVILLIPLCCISKLQMRTSRKIGVAAVFAIGIFTCITSILRTIASFRLAREADVTYEMVSVSLWSDAEIAGGIICGCMPVMPRFVRHVLPKLKSVLGIKSLDLPKNHFQFSAKSPIPKHPNHLEEDLTDFKTPVTPSANSYTLTSIDTSETSIAERQLQRHEN